MATPFFIGKTMLKEMTWKDKLKIYGILFAVGVVLLMIIALFGFAFGTGTKISHSLWGSMNL